MTIGLRLKLARVECGLSQVEAAKAIGVSQNSIHKWETDKMELSVTNGQKLSKLYNKSMSDLFSAQ